MLPHALLLNTVSTEPIPLLEADPAIRLTVLTHPEYAHRYAPSTRVLLTPDITDLSAVRAVALELLREGPIDHVVTPSERGLQPGGYLRSFLGLPGIPYEAANLCSNKYAMKQRLSAAGLPVAPYTRLGTLTELPAAAAVLGWPVLVRPVIGAASRDTHVVPDPAALTRLLATPAGEALRVPRYPLIAERFLDVAAEFHCDAVIVAGEVAFASVSRYVVPPLHRRGHLSGAYTLPAGNPDVSPVLDLHRAAVAATGLRDAITHLEVLRAGNAYHISEIAARPGGCGTCELVRHQHGVDLWRAFTDQSLGRIPPTTPTTVPGVVVKALLPATPGRVTDITPASTIADLPGVLAVTGVPTPGAVLPDDPSSLLHAGMVFARVPDERAVATFLQALGDTFTIRVRTTSEAA